MWSAAVKLLWYLQNWAVGLAMASITFYGQTATAQDLSCASVKPVATSILNWAGWTATGCSTDPVAVNTMINFVFLSAPNITWQSPVLAVVDNTISTTPAGNAQVCIPEAFDYSYAAQIWGSAFAVTVGLYLIAFKVGTILRLFKSL